MLVPSRPVCQTTQLHLPATPRRPNPLAMKQVAFLASPVTMPGSPVRRADSFEHDSQVAALRGPLAARGMELVEVSWDADEDWSRFSAAVIGTTWDYWNRETEFIETLARIEAATSLFNPVSLVNWNRRKTYLRELEAAGARLIPTVWVDDPQPDAVCAAFETLGTDDLVIKRQVGAGADGQHRLKRGEALPDLCRPMMAQPFLPSVQTEGEFSFIFIGGALSHALRKRPKPGDYRIQSLYGGYEEDVSPGADDVAAARAVITALGEPPLYGRVDMVRGNAGELLLMELELIEPYLYPRNGPKLGELFAGELVRRLG